MRYAFDLDGTLVDSKLAVHQAYVDVGVLPPEDFFTRPWFTWLNDKALHDAKNEKYLELIPSLVKPLPLMRLFKQLTGKADVSILTGASRIAAQAIVDHFQLLPDLMLCGMDMKAKISVMVEWRYGIMFEDNLSHAKNMRKETKWTVCHTL